MIFIARPGMKRSLWVDGIKPPASGGPVKWMPGEHETRWLLGKRKITKKSTAKHAVCAGGPYHNDKVRRVFQAKIGKKSQTISELPKVFTVPPYSGRYEWSNDSDRYEWRANGD